MNSRQAVRPTDPKISVHLGIDSTPLPVSKFRVFRSSKRANVASRDWVSEQRPRDVPPSTGPSFEAGRRDRTRLPSHLHPASLVHRARVPVSPATLKTCALQHATISLSVGNDGIGSAKNACAHTPSLPVQQLTTSAASRLRASPRPPPRQRRP